MRIMHQASLRKSDSEKNGNSATSDMEYENAETGLDSSGGNHEENQNGEDATDVQEGAEAPDDESASANDEEANDDDDEEEDASAPVDGDTEESPKEKSSKKAAKAKGATKEKKKRGRKPGKAATNGVKKTPKRSSKENKAHNDQEDEEDEEYEVEDIIDHKVSRGKTTYRIRWKGWGPKDDTWEAEDTLSCPDIVARYKKKMEKDDGGKKGGKKGVKRKGIPIKIAPKSKERKVDDEESSDKEWEVDRIIDIRYKKNKSREFLIRWKGWGQAHDTWEPEKHVNCPDLVKKLLEKLENAKSKTPKQLRETPKKAVRYTSNVKSKGVRTSRRHTNKQRKTYYDAE
ncbi:M-phase phosphoprotein 8 isoform X1 [Lutzomyia longipalpis]|uniref:M-phase phosphoprotein 8 isoform X1 n=2 Tax=Lutzomyia longipalpis TaxID=7200 RepID=UPI002483A78E|nr:M-phase phosphoprotein 8 isoform X1 [Lutzomyia longipalpis]